MADSEKLVIVDFSAEWCSPCKAQEPIMEELQKEYGEIIEVRKVDIEEEVEFTQSLGIRSVPTIAFFKDGELLDVTVGLTSKEELKALIIRNM